MKPTIEEVMQTAIACGFTLYSAPFTGAYCLYSEALQAFATRMIEIGRKMQRESDARIAYPKNDKSDWTPEAEHAALIAELIRNNTGE